MGTFKGKGVRDGVRSRVKGSGGWSWFMGTFKEAGVRDRVRVKSQWVRVQARVRVSSPTPTPPTPTLSLSPPTLPYRFRHLTPTTLHPLSSPPLSGGQLNASVCCIDQHLATRADQTALIWEGDELGVYTKLVASQHSRIAA